jgi:hypothetical protein
MDSRQEQKNQRWEQIRRYTRYRRPMIKDDEGRMRSGRREEDLHLTAAALPSLGQMARSPNGEGQQEGSDVGSPGQESKRMLAGVGLEIT